MLEQLLAAEGHEVAIASDGLEALAQIVSCRPDLILLDLELPELSGYEVCRRIKADPATRWIPIIILTGHIATFWVVQSELPEWALWLPRLAQFLLILLIFLRYRPQSLLPASMVERQLWSIWRSARACV